MSRFVTLISAAIIMLSVTTSRASINYTTSFPDLAGWTTFGTPAAASTDPLDGRSVYLNANPTSGATSYVQRTLASDVPFGPYTSLESTIRRSTSAYYLVYQLFRPTTDAHDAGDVQNITLFINGSAGTAQFNVTTFANNFDTTTNPAVVAFNAAMPGGNFPATGSVSDYATLTLSLPSTGAWSLSDTYHGTIFTLALGPQTGTLTTANIQIWSLGLPETGFYVDNYTLSVPEPATAGLIVLATACLHLPRRARR